MYHYFNVQVNQGGTKVRFKRHIVSQRLFVFQSNCAPDGENTWNEPGYGYGKWCPIDGSNLVKSNKMSPFYWFESLPWIIGAVLISVGWQTNNLYVVALGAFIVGVAW
jgi:hypothetical protein